MPKEKHSPRKIPGNINKIYSNKMKIWKGSLKKME
jgi:hypothetical protein